MDDRKLAIVKQIARKKGFKEEIYLSKAKNKRFAVIVDGKIVNFGLYEFKGKGTYIDHKDEKLRDAWRARHSKILLKDGTPAYKNKNSPDYWAWNLLWS